ncbi:hypothetical protein D3C86_1837750 [compost metagenome]
MGRVIARCESVQAGLRTAHAETCRRHADRQQARFQGEGPQQQNESPSQRIGSGDHRIRIASIHGPTDHNGTDRAAYLE